MLYLFLQLSLPNNYYKAAHCRVQLLHYSIMLFIRTHSVVEIISNVLLQETTWSPSLIIDEIMHACGVRRACDSKFIAGPVARSTRLPSKKYVGLSFTHQLVKN